MIDCEECIAYAHLVHARGEIKVEDINKLAIDRHVLKGCDTGQTISFWDSSKIPMDIICNGFSIKETIIEVLNKYNNGYGMDFTDEKLREMAEDMKEAFAVKLRLKQGKE
jgi:hypothetical protein